MLSYLLCRGVFLSLLVNVMLTGLCILETLTTYRCLSCADPSSFIRGGPTLTTFFVLLFV